MSDASAFKTFQTVSLYEGALGRHAQWMRWMRAITCPCIQQTTRQPDPHCDLCKGRGHIYRHPGPFKVLQEVAKHDGRGTITPRYTPVSGDISVSYRGETLELADPQPSTETITLAEPYPKLYGRLFVNYSFDPTYTIVDGATEFVKTNTLRVTGTDFTERGKSFEGSIESVSRVYNETRDESYTVASFDKEFIVLESMGSFVEGDTVVADYIYMKAFPLLFHSVSQKMRYERGYVLEDADAILVMPHWAQPAPHDLFTMLSGTQEASAVIDPTFGAGNDVIRQYFDISEPHIAIDLDGNEYLPNTDFVIVNRNEVKWLTSKPSKRYTIEFNYHPTFVSISNFDTVRTSENKSFVNRINVKQFDATNTVVRF